jgi:hypothetical protein
VKSHHNILSFAHSNETVLKVSTLFLLLILTPVLVKSQTEPTSRKGSFTFYWGYNRSAFASSNIHFTGPDYDFTVQKAVAQDKPAPFNLNTYFSLNSISIPQYNYRLGYFIDDHWNISLGLDHQKYVVDYGQTANISGAIEDYYNPFYGEYDNESMILDSSFLLFEHTDGLNYLNIEANYYKTWKETPSGNVRLETNFGGSAGLVIPRSNVTLWEERRYDAFHLSGWGLSGQIGGQVLFWKHVFIRSQIKGGFHHLPDIMTREGGGSDRAQQVIWHVMWDFGVGATWHF